LHIAKTNKEDISN